MGDWSDIAKSAASSTASSAGSGLLGLMFGGITAKRQMRNQKELMNLANDYEIAAFNRENDRQDWLLQNSALLQKKNLQNAGYSTADPNGTGVSAPTVNNQGAPASPTAPFPFASVPMDYASSYNQIAQAKKTSSEARLNEIEERYRAKLLEGQIGKLNIEIKQATDLLPERVEEIRANVQNLISNKKLNEKEGQKVLQEVENLKGVLTGIQIDNKWKDDLSRLEFNKRNAEIQNLIKDGRIKEAEAKIADMGIVLGKGTLGTIFSAAMNGKAGQIGESLTEAFSTIIKGLPDMLSDILSSIFDTAKDMVFGNGKNKWIKDKFNKVVDFIKNQDY